MTTENQPPEDDNDEATKPAGLPLVPSKETVAEPSSGGIEFVSSDSGDENPAEQAAGLPFASSDAQAEQSAIPKMPDGTPAEATPPPSESAMSESTPSESVPSEPAPPSAPSPGAAKSTVAQTSQPPSGAPAAAGAPGRPQRFNPHQWADDGPAVSEGAAPVDPIVTESRAAEPAPAPAPIAALKPADTNHRVAGDSRGRTMSEKDFRSLSRRSLLTGGIGAVAAFVGWRTLQDRPVADRIPDVLRTGHEVNESIWRTLFRDGSEAPTFDFAESSMMRINGRHGLDDELDLATWELRVVGVDGELLGTHQVEDLREMRQTEMTVEHKCVEGWSHIVTWGGVRFSEFVATFYPEQADAKFVGLATPDNEFRVGLDMPSMMHSQTMLSLDLQREPLSEEHGAPVRLTTPLKYGTKQLKRIGTIEFSNTQPENDFWTSRGYDWYAGL